MTDKKETKEKKEEVTGYDFEAVMKANKEKKDKEAEKRKNGNKKVLKDYRIK